MKTKEIIIAVVYVVFTTALCVACNLASKNSSSSSQSSSSTAVDNTSESEYIESHDTEIATCDTSDVAHVYKVEESYQTIEDDNEWIYGTWECRTKYGTMKLIIQDNGRMYDSVEERWCSYSIEGDEIVEHVLDGLVSTYHIDRVNKRFDCGNYENWFKKITN